MYVNDVHRGSWLYTRGIERRAGGMMSMSFFFSHTLSLFYSPASFPCDLSPAWHFLFTSTAPDGGWQELALGYRGVQYRTGWDASAVVRVLAGGRREVDRRGGNKIQKRRPTFRVSYKQRPRPRAASPALQTLVRSKEAVDPGVHMSALDRRRRSYVLTLTYTDASAYRYLSEAARPHHRTLPSHLGKESPSHRAKRS